jgi:hypothetical protein
MMWERWLELRWGPSSGKQWVMLWVMWMAHGLGWLLAAVREQLLVRLWVTELE